MDSRRTFGRRALSQSDAIQRSIPQPSASEATMPTRDTRPLPPPSEPMLSVEDEIEAWKASRRPVASFPWRQLSLMAGLCFGIASFVLPDSINDAVQWLFYGLAAISLYMGLHKRRSN